LEGNQKYRGVLIDKAYLGKRVQRKRRCEKKGRRKCQQRLVKVSANGKEFPACLRGSPMREGNTRGGAEKPEDSAPGVNEEKGGGV